MCTFSLNLWLDFVPILWIFALQFSKVRQVRYIPYALISNPFSPRNHFWSEGVPWKLRPHIVVSCITFVNTCIIIFDTVPTSLEFENSGLHSYKAIPSPPSSATKHALASIIIQKEKLRSPISHPPIRAYKGRLSWLARIVVCERLLIPPYLEHCPQMAESPLIFSTRTTYENWLMDSPTSSSWISFPTGNR